MYTDDFLDTMDRWEIPEEFHPMMDKLISQFGEEWVGQCMEYRDGKPTPEYMEEWEKHIREPILFIADHWNEAFDIICEAFDLDGAIDSGLVDEDYFLDKLSRKDMIYFT